MALNRTRTRTIAGVVGALLIAAPLAACSSEDEGSGSGGSSSSSAPEPVAVVEDVKGQTTQVTLDQGFVDAITGLGLTPAAVGGGELVDGALRFPISGGNVTVFTPGEVSPYVIGQLQHEGSGFTLTAGDTEVTIGNLNVDPGVSRVYGDVLLNGDPVVSSAYIFRLNGSTLMPLEADADAGTATLEGTEVYVSDVAAQLLNDTFGTDAVTDQLLVGIAKITVNTGAGS
ncbi:hypothetical protein [Nocardioides nanhaiensis]|uniref:Lipoprotein n=1 Tax=Nocardioides nanhaiensis TaxID=1476871 RepID=A0ABP8W441_9ACTN